MQDKITFLVEIQDYTVYINGTEIESACFTREEIGTAISYWLFDTGLFEDV